MFQMSTVWGRTASGRRSNLTVVQMRLSSSGQPTMVVWSTVVVSSETTAMLAVLPTSGCFWIRNVPEGASAVFRCQTKPWKAPAPVLKILRITWRRLTPAKRVRIYKAYISYIGIHMYKYSWDFAKPSETVVASSKPDSVVSYKILFDINCTVRSQRET